MSVQTLCLALALFLLLNLGAGMWRVVRGPTGAATPVWYRLVADAGAGGTRT